MEYEFVTHIKGTSLKTFVVVINQREYHFHSDMEIMMVLDGSMSLDDGKERHLLRKNDIFLCNRNEIHSLRHTDQNNMSIVIQFDLDLCKAYYPKITHVRFRHKHIIKEKSYEYWNRLRQCMIDIVTCYTQKKDGHPIEMMAILNHMIYTMIQYDNYILLDEKTVNAESRNMDRMRHIIEYIKDNFMYPITLKEIAHKEKLDMYYLSHFIKNYLGISFQKYLRRIRVEKAENLLLNTNLNLIDICMECGFSDYKYLNKAFQDEFHCSPTEYRKTNKRRQEDVSECSEQHIMMEADRALKAIKKNESE